MKLRHAAALALVGWYLMVPPLQREVCCGLIVYGDPFSMWFWRHDGTKTPFGRRRHDRSCQKELNVAILPLPVPGGGGPSALFEVRGRKS
jgi:hypothetical protein